MRAPKLHEGRHQHAILMAPLERNDGFRTFSHLGHELGAIFGGDAWAGTASGLLKGSYGARMVAGLVIDSGPQLLAHADFWQLRNAFG